MGIQPLMARVEVQLITSVPFTFFFQPIHQCAGVASFEFSGIRNEVIQVEHFSPGHELCEAVTCKGCDFILFIDECDQVIPLLLLSPDFFNIGVFYQMRTKRSHDMKTVGQLLAGGYFFNETTQWVAFVSGLALPEDTL